MFIINLRFSGRVSKPTKTSNKYHLFYNTVLLKKYHSFKNVNSLNILKNILPQHSQKPFPLYKFSGKLVSGWYQIKYLHCTISRWPKTAFSKLWESKYLYIPVNLHKKTSTRNIRSLRIYKCLVGGGWIIFISWLIVFTL